MSNELECNDWSPAKIEEMSQRDAKERERLAEVRRARLKRLKCETNVTAARVLEILASGAKLESSPYSSTHWDLIDGKLMIVSPHPLTGIRHYIEPDKWWAKPIATEVYFTPKEI